MARRSVFYSFHFDNDVMRTQQVRNIGALERDEPVSASAWEMVRRSGDRAIQNWIDTNMTRRQCVIVLAGSQTAYRPWVQYEIKKAWADGRGLFGIYIHNLKDPRTGTCAQGPNPFGQFTLKGKPFSDFVRCHDPHALYPYQEIANNIESWVETAIAEAKQR
jgi:hypothetical protein